MFISNSEPLYEGNETRQETSRRFPARSSVLSLPKLSPDIVPYISDSNYVRHLSALALNFYASGYLSDSDEHIVEPSSLIKTAMQRWVNEKMVSSKLFHFNLSFTPDITTLEYVEHEMNDYDKFIKNIKKVTGKCPMFLEVYFKDVESKAIGEQLEKFESLHPGLGKTAYYYLATKGYRHGRVSTPWTAFDLAKYVYWYGYDDENDFIEESEQDMDPEEPPYLHSDFIDAFPIWATTLEDVLKIDDIKGLCEHSDLSIAELAKALLDVIQLDDEKQDLFIDETLPLTMIHSSVYLCWEDGDDSERVLHDWENDIYQSGADNYTELAMFTPVPIKPAQFMAWMADMEEFFNNFSKLERLISFITEKEKNHV